MQIFNFNQRSPEWLAARKGKVTGSRLSGLYIAPTKTELCLRYLKQGLNDEQIIKLADCSSATLTAAKKVILSAPTPQKRKLGFYEILAERLGIADEDPFLEEIGAMQRGNVLEQEGLDLWAEKNKMQLVQVGLCVSDENPAVAFSPDSLIADKDGVFTASVEEKCLKPSKHLQAYFEQKMPDEYFEQTIQPFIVSDEIQKVYCVFYNPRVLDLPIFHVTINRADVLNDIQNLKAYQVEALIEMDNLIKTLKSSI